MNNEISYKMAKLKNVVFDYFPAVAYLAVVDLKRYQFFVAKDLDYRGMLSHLGEEMNNQSCVAWGCPEKQLKIQLIFTQDHKALEAAANRASAFQRWIRTDGELCFASHNELYLCATREMPVFSKVRSRDPDKFLPRRLIVPPGFYSVSVFRHFPWFEGDQDAPKINRGVNFTVILRYYENESHLCDIEPPSLVPWV
jgi:hypothetical protein